MGAVVKLKEKQKPSFMDTLASTAKTKTPTTKKSSVPVLDAPPEIKEAVDQYIDAKEREKIATAEKDSAGLQIMDFVKPIQDEDGIKGSFRNSYGVPGTKPQNKVTFVSSNRYSINGEDVDKIEGILGDNFPEMITKKFQVKLKAIIFENAEMQAELMELVGERFNDFFETEVSLAVKEGFNQRIYTAIPEQLDDLRLFCKQYKPSLR
jgi:transcription initiation factor TFIID subunit TAF12